ncbi:MAG: hypothetical protein GF398_16820 [Chitinivibrionales bacterium]|nr:hypothetical protein [Chitinivibrionales bacterium]
MSQGNEMSGCENMVNRQLWVVLLCLWGHYQVSAQENFHHPGMLTGLWELTHMRMQTAEPSTPNAIAYETVLHDGRYSGMMSLSYRHSVTDTLKPKFSEWKDDATACYLHALQWYITTDTAYARKVLEIVDAWGISATQVAEAKVSEYALHLGTGLTDFCKATEIVKHTWEDWNPQAEQRFTDMVQRILLGPIAIRSGNNNIDYIRAAARMGFAVVIDSIEMFEHQIEWYRDAIESYSRDYGQIMEVCRDPQHAGMAMGGIARVCEIAWQQGIDLYSHLDNRVQEIFEHEAILRNGEIPERIPTDFPNQQKNSDNRDLACEEYWYAAWARGVGKVDPWGDEIVYNHYVNRKGLAMPQLQKRIAYTRENSSWDGIHGCSGLGTLTHAEAGNPPITKNILRPASANGHKKLRRRSRVVYTLLGKKVTLTPAGDLPIEMPPGVYVIFNDFTEKMTRTGGWR